MIKRIIEIYVKNFPNLEYCRGVCDTYGLDIEYTQGYFTRMLRWASGCDTQYTVSVKKRGSQTD